MAPRKRDYRKEYDDYHGTPEQIKRRSQRNKARRKVGLKPGDPREAHHSGDNRKGDLDNSKVVAISKKKNRSKQPKRDGSED